MRVIRELTSADQRIIGIGLSRNFGQYSALLAGLHEASGDVVVCMDDDGQTPLEEKPLLLDALDAETDVVYARYRARKQGWFRNFASRVNDRMTV